MTQTSLIFTVSTKCISELIGGAFSKQYILTENFLMMVLSEFLGQANIPIILVTDDKDLFESMSGLVHKFDIKVISFDGDCEDVVRQISSSSQTIFVDIISCFILADTLQRMLLRLKASEIVYVDGGGALVAKNVHAINIMREILGCRLQTSVFKCFDAYMNPQECTSVCGFSAENIFEKKSASNTEFTTNLKSYQSYVLKKYMQTGLSIINPENIDLRGCLRFGKNVFLDNNVSIRGDVVLGDNVTVGANSILENITIEENSEIKENCILTSSEIGRSCRVGPYARLRSGTILGDGSHIGNFVEIKNSQIGMHCKINHHNFIGDATLGDAVIVGAGTITCNFDGSKNNETVIDDHVFIGSSVQLVAPVHISSHAFVAAGSTITRDVTSYSLAIARAKQVDIENWVKERRLKNDVN